MIKYGYVLPQQDSCSVFKFIKLDLEEQMNLLSNEGILVDGYDEKETSTKVYFLNGFFVEETINTRTKKVVEVLPFKQGYKTEKYFEVREVLTLRNSLN